MPFDPIHAAPRPYMREGTAALAALVATGPTRAVLSLVYAELQHRERPAARRLRDELSAMLSSVPQPDPDLVTVEPDTTDAGSIPLPPIPPPPPVLSEPAPKPAKRAKLPPMTREENQAARGAFNRLRWAAEDAAERETGRDAYGQPMWPSVPGVAHHIEVPPSVSQYVALSGKVQRGASSMILPAPRFWPGGTLPEGYQDMGEHVPPIPRAAAPGSAEWRRWVDMQHATEARLAAEKQDSERIANETFKAMEAKPKRRTRRAA